MTYITCLNIRIFNDLTQIKQIMNNFTHLKLWIAVARHNFKWVEFFFSTYRALRVMIKDSNADSEISLDRNKKTQN